MVGVNIDFWLLNRKKKLLNFAVDLGNFLKSEQNSDKVNIGMLGNVVSQLHLHVVLRNKDDPAWPGPVWGWKPSSNLDQKIKQIRSNLILEFLK